jgi:hypothetical protein
VTALMLIFFTLVLVLGGLLGKVASILIRKYLDATRSAFAYQKGWPGPSYMSSSGRPS